MQTIGERLEEARKRKGISIREAAEATKIRGDYLQKFESNQFDLGLAELYVRGFLRLYAQFLRLPADKIVNDFNAVTAGSSSSRRTPSREVYGRMDLSVASADEPDAGAAAAPGAAAEPDSSPGRPSFTRGGGSIPQGPAIDYNMIAKGVIWVGVVVVLGAILWGLKSCVGGGKAAAPATATTKAEAPPAAQAPTVTLVGLGPVTVEVARPSPGNADVAGEILWRGQLATGQRKVIDRPGELLITASAWENVGLEMNGQRVSTGYTGYKMARLPAP